MRTRTDYDWMDPHRLRVHATSEAPGYPAANAFARRASNGWRAGRPGPQVITIRFPRPSDLSCVRLVFESSDARTHEFSVSWSARRGEAHGHVVRQQFNFSPAGAKCEIEEYQVELREVDRLEIRVIPDISGGPAVASLRECRIA